LQRQYLETNLQNLITGGVLIFNIIVIMMLIILIACSHPNAYFYKAQR